MLLFFVMSVFGCDSGKFGIAGAGYDSDETVAKLHAYVDAYRPYISPEITESVVDDKCSENNSGETRVTQYKDYLQSFVFHADGFWEQEPLLIPDFVPNSNLKVSTAGGQFIFAKGEKIIARSERLPKGFGWGTKLGVDTLGGKYVIVTLSRTRATSSPGFVAIAMYDFDGQALYQNILLKSEIRNIEWTTQSININTCSKTRKIMAKTTPRDKS